MRIFLPMDVICRSQQIKWPIQLCGDNQGGLALAQNPTSHHRTKHMDLRDKFVTELVSQKVIEVAYIHTSHMVVDGFTHPFSKDQHIQFLRQIGLVHRDRGTLDNTSNLKQQRDDQMQPEDKVQDSDARPLIFLRNWLRFLR